MFVNNDGVPSEYIRMTNGRRAEVSNGVYPNTVQFGVEAA
jgi:hypothetical protein